MSTVIFRRGIVAAQKVKKVLHLVGSPPKCWTSVLTAAAAAAAAAPGGRVSLQPCCWASAATLPPGGRLGELLNPASSCLLGNRPFHSSAVRSKKRVQPPPPPREVDLLRYDMKNLWDGPKPALYLGFAGLLPFAGPTLFMGVSEFYVPELAYAQLAYAASIVSFLGGARWGFALPETSPAKPDWMNLSNSVVPSLLAWTTMLMSDSLLSATTMVIMALGIALHYDLALLPTYPSWFKALRAILTVVALFSLTGTLCIKQVYPEKNLPPLTWT